MRLVIIDENGPARDMLARRLASLPDMEVVGSTGDSEEGLRQIQEYAPDIVLLDIKMRRASGLEICRRACSINGKAKVIVLTSYNEPEERRMAFQSGASGYLLKEADTQKLVQRIRQLTGGIEPNSVCGSVQALG